MSARVPASYWGHIPANSRSKIRLQVWSLKPQYWGEAITNLAEKWGVSETVIRRIVLNNPTEWDVYLASMERDGWRLLGHMTEEGILR